MVRISAISLLFVFLVGCNADGDLGTQVTNPPANSEDRIKKIEEDPNMPEQAKAASIAAIRAQEKNGAAQSEAMQKSKK